MIPKKLGVYTVFFPYGGNGGISMEHPSIRNWFTHTALACKDDERIQFFKWNDISDTPITMTRNRSVQQAREIGADILVMVDSDMHPDKYVSHDPAATPFFQSSFDFLYAHHDKGPVAVAAPYCGPPPHENVYIFKFWSPESDSANHNMKLDQYSRDEAAQMAGIQECAALPTGLCMFDIRMFDLLVPPYFSYEWTDDYQQDKASTEDVFCTRDMFLAGTERLGYNPVFCNWDAWAGHYKPKCVGKPSMLTADQINASFKAAVLAGRHSADRMVHVNGGLKAFGKNAVLVD